MDNADLRKMLDGQIVREKIAPSDLIHRQSLLNLDGKILHREFVNPLPGSDKNISSFVEPGKENFTIDQTGTIHIKGKWKDINNYEDDDHEFSSSVKSF